MLFIQTKRLTLFLTEGERLRLLDALTTKELTPLIRAMRRRCFAQLLTEQTDAARVASAANEFERQCSEERAQSNDDTTRHSGATSDVRAYTPGELFCVGDCILFLVFGADAEAGLNSGIVYNNDTTEPLIKLDRFCRNVRAALAETGKGAAADEADGFTRSQPRSDQAAQGLARFIAIQPTDFAVAAKCRSSAREVMRASELMEEAPVRLFLRRAQEMRREGYSPRRLFAEADKLGRISVGDMLAAGLLEREVRVSCRQSGHALFDLPSPDSLAAITISKAKCSLCAAPVADEVIEETINPTRLAVALLADGQWLHNRVYKMIRALGVPDSEIATGPVSAHGESYLAAHVCGSSFLFVTRDGDLTPAFSRRIAETVTEMEATHLVVVITGAVEDEGRLRLYEFTWRRARGGQDLDTTLVEGLHAAQAQIERAFDRAVHRELTRHLFALDTALGLSATNFVRRWFKLKAAGETTPKPPAPLLAISSAPAT
jgi:hypothetical protein